jgi:hypothetical protein
MCIDDLAWQVFFYSNFCDGSLRSTRTLKEMDQEPLAAMLMAGQLKAGRSVPSWIAC